MNKPDRVLQTIGSVLMFGGLGTLFFRYQLNATHWWQLVLSLIAFVLGLVMIAGGSE